MIKTAALVTLAEALLLTTFGASAQSSTPRSAPGAAANAKAHEAPAPTPRFADGTVNLGGDGIWDQKWITDFGKQLVGSKEIPFLPWTKAMYDYNAATKVAY